VKKTRKIIIHYLGKYLKIFGWGFFTTLVALFLLQQIGKVITIPSHGAWGIFHYYIGAKYIKELGYFDLYSCALKTHSPTLQSIKTVRNLYTYELVPIKSLKNCPTEKFSKEKWKSFVTDVQIITKRAPSSYWEYVFTDKGFNPPPFWTAIAQPIANVFSPNNPVVYFFLFNLDILFISLASLIIVHFYGKKLGLVTFALSLFYFGTVNTLTNNFIQFAWYPLIVTSLLCWQKNKYALSGVALGFASGLQAFPALFAIPVFLLLLSSLLSVHKENAKKSITFIITFLSVLIFCFLIGGVSIGKMSIWKEWNNKITIHKEYTKGEIFNIGLVNLVGTFLSSERTAFNTYREDYPFTKLRNEALEKNKILSIIAGAIALAFVLLVFFKTNQKQPLTFGYFFLYIALCLSPYYYLILSLIPFAFWNNSPNTRTFALYGTIVLFILHVVLFSQVSYVSFNYFLHLISEISIFVFFSALLALLFLENKKGPRRD